MSFMMHNVDVYLNRRTNGTLTVLNTIQVKPYRFGDPLELLPTRYSFEAGTPTRVAENILKLVGMPEVTDANGAVWPADEREFGVGDILVITDENGTVTIYTRNKYSWSRLSENEMPYPDDLVTSIES